ncbi:hypothetical protein DL96DRAFT_1616418 [Flagelloscypha sp. PMI_526]|nr:hypothetical protein DL96DRAFT_1616418 [Flagelloscypha sp. PMI_526]
MTTILSLNNIEDLKGKDVFILFGKTRAGKSTFINDVYQEEVTKSTTGLKSDTNEISYVSTPCLVDQRKIVLVDTIGLGGSGDEHDRVSLAVKWVEIFRPSRDSKRYQGGSPNPAVKGFLYFIDISDGAGLNKDGQRNLNFFKALIGTEVMESVIFVTTKWATDENARDVQEDYFEQWTREIQVTFPGASIFRLDNETSRLSIRRLDRLSPEDRGQEKRKYYENAMKVLRELLRHEATIPTQLERDLNKDATGLVMNDTALGQLVRDELIEDARLAIGAGMHEEAKELIASAAVLTYIPVSEASQIKDAREAARMIFGDFGEPIGETLYEFGRTMTEICKSFSTEKQQAVLERSFAKTTAMNSRWARRGAENGKMILGPTGQVLGGIIACSASGVTNTLVGGFDWLRALG